MNVAVFGIGAIIGGLLVQHLRDATSSPLPSVETVGTARLAAVATPDERGEARASQPPPPSVVPGLRLLHGEAAAFIPETWDQLADLTAGPAVVRPLAIVRTEAPASTRHQVTAAEAAGLNASRPADSVKPFVREGDWIGSPGIVTTVYRAEVQWLADDAAPEVLEVRFVGGAFADSFLVIDGVPLPEVGAEYLMFLGVGSDWVSPVYVQFAVEADRLAPRMHNESGIGKTLLGLSLPQVRDMAMGYEFRNNGMPR